MHIYNRLGDQYRVLRTEYTLLCADAFSPIVARVLQSLALLVRLMFWDPKAVLLFSIFIQNPSYIISRLLIAAQVLAGDELSWTGERSTAMYMSKKTKGQRKRKIKNIQQRGFASGHPPNY
jgi:hypothetical protein